LYTVEKTEWTSVEKFFGNVTKPDEEIYVTSSPVHAGLSKTSNLILAYMRFLGQLAKLCIKTKYDLAINTYGDLVNSIVNVAYVHFPIVATVDYPQTPAFMSPLKWKMTLGIYATVASVLDKIRPSFLLTNSTFTQQVIGKYLKREALVLHPPVDVQTYTCHNIDRENLVVTVSKFTPKRMLRRIPLIARNTENAKFVVAGAADAYSTATIQDLTRLIDKCGVRDRVSLCPNIPRSALIDLLSSAKVYLHVMPSDHFGISIIEAMAAGCVPVVHGSGGPWLDILAQQQGEMGFGYWTIEEAARHINAVMADKNHWRKLSSAACERSKEYSRQKFQKKLNVVVRELVST
jgi:glycosyltransferase involved in cell wall biosynthesis